MNLFTLSHHQLIEMQLRIIIAPRLLTYNGDGILELKLCGVVAEGEVNSTGVL